MHIRITYRSSRHDLVMGGYSFFHDDHGSLSWRNLLRLSYHGYVHICIYVHIYICIYDTYHGLKCLCIYHRYIKCFLKYFIYDDHGSLSRRDFLRLSHYGYVHVCIYTYDTYHGLKYLYVYHIYIKCMYYLRLLWFAPRIPLWVSTCICIYICVYIHKYIDLYVCINICLYTYNICIHVIWIKVFAYINIVNVLYIRIISYFRGPLLLGLPVRGGYLWSFF
jgi:hypothetical protein